MSLIFYKEKSFIDVANGWNLKTKKSIFYIHNI
ncbi:unnamed protein product [Larinioides sclopetarius]|uniref:Uncharacterized protein n=1 Tax=Larinioides sclopetarius TaxID=280406 RepID=A0AAV2BG88_9ARAC